MNESSVILVGSEVSKVADGKNTFTYTVTVSDGNGNPVSGATVSPSTSDTTNTTGAVTDGTDAIGQTTVTLTSTTTATADVTVSAAIGDAPDSNADKAVSFTADKANALVELTWINSEELIMADGSDLNIIKRKVFDINGNIISDVTIDLSFPNGVNLSSSSGAIVSDNIESFSFSMSSTGSGNKEITATIDESQKTSKVDVYFSPVNINFSININK